MALRLVLATAYGCLCVGGVVSYAFMGGPPEGLKWTAPVYLALAGVLVLAYTPVKQWQGPLTAALIGFASELSGVAYGLPYGHYEYTPILGPALLGVPLVLTCAWLVLAAHVRGAMEAWRIPASVQPFLGAAWMTALDLVIDPLAAGVWAGGHAACPERAGEPSREGHQRGLRGHASAEYPGIS